MKKLFIITLFLVVVPVAVFGQDLIPPDLISKQGLLPNCGVIVGTKINRECGYYDLLQLVNNIINWIIMISVPIAAGVIAWAGFKYMTTGISDQKSAAKDMLLKVAKGLFFILAAWLIVNTILNALLSSDPNLRKAIPVEGVKK